MRDNCFFVRFFVIFYGLFGLSFLCVAGEVTESIGKKFLATGPAFSSPLSDGKNLYIASGFSSDCNGLGQIRKLSLLDLSEEWLTLVKGAVGDTPLVLADDLILFGAGNGVVALDKSTGAVAWQIGLEGCFQESFGKFENGVYYTGSSSGALYAIDAEKGQRLWQKKLKGAVFGQPAILENLIVFADGSGLVRAFNVQSGKEQWSLQIDPPTGAGTLAGSFGGFLSLDHTHLYLAASNGYVYRMTMEGKIVASHLSRNRYIAMPVLCGEKLVVADMKGQVLWLDKETLQVMHRKQLKDGYLFGEPQCIEPELTLVSTYSGPSGRSSLHFLRDGQNIEKLPFQSILHALPKTLIQGEFLYNVLTPYGNGGGEAYLFDVVRTPLPDFKR